MFFARLDRSRLPLEEHDLATLLETNLVQLELISRSYTCTLDLFLHTRLLVAAGQIDKWKKVGWTKIAGRNGSIEAYGFCKVLEAINRLNAPTIHSLCDLEQRKAGWKLFKDSFPDIVGIRNAAAHPGELMATAAELQKHRLRTSISSPEMQLGPGAFVSDMMGVEGNVLTFSASFNGNHVSYELSERTAAALQNVAELYHKTFYPIEDPMTAGARNAARLG